MENSTPNPSELYPVIAGSNKNKTIIAVYGDMVVKVNHEKSEIDVINAKPSKSLIIDFEIVFGPCQVQTVDCLGTNVDSEKMEIGKGVSKFFVPPSGMVSLKKNLP